MAGLKRAVPVKRRRKARAGPPNVDKLFYFYTPFRMTMDPEVIKTYGVPMSEDIGDGFKQTANLERLVKYPLNLMEVVSMYDNGIEVKFFNKEQIPEFYEMLKYVCGELLPRKESYNFSMPLYESVLELADHIFDTYQRRLIDHYYDDREKANEFYTGLTKADFELNRIKR